MNRRFDYAISFAGPQRKLARQLAHQLTSGGCRVFFDEFFESEMIGRDGSEYLNHVFLNDSRYCIALLSHDYEKHVWSQLERRAAQARELEEGTGFLIPVLLDDVRPEWLLPTKIFFDLNQRPLTELVSILARKIEGRAPETITLRSRAGASILGRQANPAKARLRDGLTSGSAAHWVAGPVSREDARQMKRAMTVLEWWGSPRLLNRRHRQIIAKVVREHELQFVPVWVLAALCGVSVSTAKGYVHSGVFAPAAVYSGMDVFEAEAVRIRLEAFRQIRKRRGTTVSQAGKLITETFGPSAVRLRACEQMGFPGPAGP